MPWSPNSWSERPCAQEVVYPEYSDVQEVELKLRSLPPLVTSWEIERLKRHLAEAQEGRRFLLQGGDCAEMLDDCVPTIITNKLKILLQMSIVLIHGGKRPVIRVGRLAGQYAKPRSRGHEQRGGETHPSYFGDLHNSVPFTAGARRPDPRRMLDCYMHAAMTLNFIRSLSASGFADLHHPEYWDLSFMSRSDLSDELREQYQAYTQQLSEALDFMEALGERTVSDLSRIEFFTSHEGLNLRYESAQTRLVPRREGFYTLTAHMPWIGERTRALDGAHVEFFRGIRNPVGIKLGPSATGEQAVALARALNPDNEPGKIVFITRMGMNRVHERLPGLLSAIKRAELRVLWVCDPMHGNTRTTARGIKTRNFDDILGEINRCFEVHADCGTLLGGVHFELTGDNVTECTGGGLDEQDLDSNYASACDPRLNYRQSLEMAFALARRMGASR
jgi:3-deoxy-7-phosphoheptulonate synthase